jgi:hypothetical protein
MQHAAQFPGPQDRAWRIGLGCLAFLSLIPAALAAPVFLAWFLLGKGENLPFPVAALLAYVPALLSIGLGIWTWRAKKVWWLAALVAVAAGAFGLSFLVVFVLFGLLMRFF